MIQVITKTECDKCGMKHERNGTEGSYPPIGWVEVSLTYRREGSGWTNSDRYEKQLCPDCAQEVVKLLNLS